MRILQQFFLLEMNYQLSIKIFRFFLFSFERDNFGKIEVHDLIENGRNISVTNENKKEYVEKICYAKMAQDIKEQIQQFLSGFNELIPTNIISIFDSMELELMISGLPDIDSKDFFIENQLISYYYCYFVVNSPRSERKH